MSVSKKENENSTKVELKNVKGKKITYVDAKKSEDVSTKIIANLDSKFEKLAELELRLKKVEQRMGL